MDYEPQEQQEYIYILQLKKHNSIRQPVYKIGRTCNLSTRFIKKDYRQGVVILYVRKVNDCAKVEKHLLLMLGKNSEFSRIKGRVEYFVCSLAHLINCTNNLIKKMNQECEYDIQHISNELTNCYGKYDVSIKITEDVKYHDFFTESVHNENTVFDFGNGKECKLITNKTNNSSKKKQKNDDEENKHKHPSGCDISDITCIYETIFKIESKIEEREKHFTENNIQNKKTCSQCQKEFNSENMCEHVFIFNAKKKHIDDIILSNTEHKKMLRKLKQKIIEFHNSKQ